MIFKRDHDRRVTVALPSRYRRVTVALPSRYRRVTVALPSRDRSWNLGGQQIISGPIFSDSSYKIILRPNFLALET
jgi:hypothetical protein